MLCHQGYEFYCFHQAWRLIDNAFDSNYPEQGLMLPWVVNGAFTCELGLKYMLATKDIPYGRTHLLHELISLLPDEQRLPIMTAIQQTYFMDTEEAIDDKIRMLSNAFEDFRYAYEHKVIVDVVFARTVFEAIIRQTCTFPMYNITEIEISKDTLEDAEKLEQECIDDTLARVQKKERRK